MQASAPISPDDAGAGNGPDREDLARLDAMSLEDAFRDFNTKMRHAIALRAALRKAVAARDDTKRYLTARAARELGDSAVVVDGLAWKVTKDRKGFDVFTIASTSPET